MSGKKDDKLKCSFCGKTQDQVTRLIAGPGVIFVTSVYNFARRSWKMR